MPLLIDLKPGEKVIINGSVIENAGTNTKLRVYNDSNILRQKEILSNADLQTPASRVYFCLQCAYIFPDKRDHYLEHFRLYLEEYVTACPSAAGIGAEATQAVADGQYYRALKAARKLLKHEAGVLDQLHQAAEKWSADAVEEEAGADAEAEPS